MKTVKYIVLFFLLISFSIVFSQNNSFNNNLDDDIRGKNEFRIMFYNLENFYDNWKDSLRNYNDFTSFGAMHWGIKKFNTKLNNIYKVIIAVGGWEPPELIGVCEIENRFVLNSLVLGTPLRKYNYKVIHEDSPDLRGIDVALIYRQDKFTEIYHYPIRIIFPFDTASKTRDILYVRGLTNNKDTLHVFVNHFPSKFGGALISQPKRNYVASVLRNAIDTLIKNNMNPIIIIMGDFNDEAEDESLTKYLKVKCDTIYNKDADIINLMCGLKKIEGIGTNKFHDQWSLIDQFMVSSSLMKENNKWQVKNKRAYIFKPDFLLMPDEAYFGVKPFRTFYGPKYLGGFSDHLPVYFDLISN